MLSTDQPPSGCVELGQLIRAARRFRGLSQTQLAERVTWITAAVEPPVNRIRVAQWERAHRRISQEFLSRIETVLNVGFVGVDRAVKSAHHAGEWCEVTGKDPCFLSKSFFVHLKEKPTMNAVEPTTGHVKQLRDSLHTLERSAGFNHTEAGRAAIRCIRVVVILITDLAKRVEAVELKHGG